MHSIIIEICLYLSIQWFDIFCLTCVTYFIDKLRVYYDNYSVSSLNLGGIEMLVKLRYLDVEGTFIRFAVYWILLQGIFMLLLT